MKAAHSFEISAATHPRTQRYVTKSTILKNIAVRNLNLALSAVKVYSPGNNLKGGGIT